MSNNFVLNDLKEHLWDRKPFTPHMTGGSGHKYSEEKINIMRKLHNHGIEICTGPINKYDDTALHLAYAHRNQPMIDFLLEIGADPNAQRYDGRLPHELGKPLYYQLITMEGDGPVIRF